MVINIAGSYIFLHNNFSYVLNKIVTNLIYLK
jgi:hypothetical protein